MDSEDNNTCIIKGCKRLARENERCFEHKNIEELRKVCELEGCEEEFDVTNVTQMYCPEHRTGGKKHFETVRVTKYGWKAKDKVCALPECPNVLPKNKSKYCSEACYTKGKRRTQMYDKMEKLQEKYDLTWEEVEMLNQISIDLSYYKYHHGFEGLKKIVNKMLDEEGRNFTEKALFRVPLKDEEKHELNIEPASLE